MGRILTTHAGSLPRPKELDALWARHWRGEAVDEQEIDAIVEQATADVIARQVEVGLDIVGNGEQGRESFFTHVRERFSGFGGMGDLRPFRDIRAFPQYLQARMPLYTDPNSVSLAQVPAAVDEVRYLGTDAIERELAQLQRYAGPLQPHDVFLTVPSPGIVAAAMTNRYYDTIEHYIDAVADGLTHEYRACIDAGALLQIDAPDLAMERHNLFAERPLDDFVAFADHVVAAINHAVEGLPRERIRLHVCWGNYDGPHCFDVPLEDMLATYSKATRRHDRALVGEPAPRPRVPAARRTPARVQRGRGMHRHHLELCGAPASGVRPFGARGRDDRRPRPRAGRNRLRLRECGRHARRRTRRRLGEVAVADEARDGVRALVLPDYGSSNGSRDRPVT